MIKLFWFILIDKYCKNLISTTKDLIYEYEMRVSTHLHMVLFRLYLKYIRNQISNSNQPQPRTSELSLKDPEKVTSAQII